MFAAACNSKDLGTNSTLSNLRAIALCKFFTRHGADAPLRTAEFGAPLRRELFVASVKMIAACCASRFGADEMDWCSREPNHAPKVCHSNR